MSAPDAPEDHNGEHDVRAAARGYADGSIDIGELWEVWHRHVVRLVADGLLDGDLRELNLRLRAWEHAEGEDRDAAAERTRAAARRVGREVP